MKSKMSIEEEYVRQQIKNCKGTIGYVKNMLNNPSNSLFSKSELKRSIKFHKAGLRIMKKHLPMRVLNIEHKKDWNYHTNYATGDCPTCGEWVADTDHKYCPACGQLLDWDYEDKEND